MGCGLVNKEKIISCLFNFPNNFFNQLKSKTQIYFKILLPQIYLTNKLNFRSLKNPKNIVEDLYKKEIFTYSSSGFLEYCNLVGNFQSHAINESLINSIFLICFIIFRVIPAISHFQILKIICSNSNFHIGWQSFHHTFHFSSKASIIFKSIHHFFHFFKLR